jgi:hypothetical protein
VFRQNLSAPRIDLHLPGDLPARPLETEIVQTDARKER